MAKQTPAPPDYGSAAQAQAAGSRQVTEQQTWANRPDQYTPWGSSTWSSTPHYDEATGQYINMWTNETQLAPELQAALDSQTASQLQRSNLAYGMNERLANEYGQGFDFNNAGFTDLASTPQAQQYQTPEMQRQLDMQGLQGVDPSQRYYQQAGDAVYNQWAARALPAQQQATEQLRTQLYNAGLKEGDAAYDNEMAKLRMQQGDAQQQAAFQATQAAGTEASRMYGMDQGTRQMQFDELLKQAQFGNQAAQQQLQQEMASGAQTYGQQLQSAQYQNQLRQQQISEALQQRGFTLNEINALLSGQQVSMPSMPNFNQANRAEGLRALDATNMQWGANIDAYNAEQQARQGMMEGIGSIAGSFTGMMSSRKVKKHIKRVGTTPGGTPVYRFQYVWGGPMYIGVMADEAPPEAVTNINGAVYVDYSKVK